MAGKQTYNYPFQKDTESTPELEHWRKGMDVVGNLKENGHNEAYIQGMKDGLNFMLEFSRPDIIHA